MPTLVFRDGKVHNVHLTKEMVAAPRTYVYSRGRSSLSFANIALPLKMNPKPYIFRLPEQAPYELGDRNSCSQLTFHPGQSGITSIEGNGGNYLVHLCKRMILRLSTPGGFANAVHRLDYSSTWDLDAHALGSVTIELQGTQLYLGSTTIHVPEYGGDDLVDQMSIIGAHGIIHTVDLIFDMIYIGGLDGRYFEPPKDDKSPWPDEFAEIADKELRVNHIIMADGSAGYLKYNLAQRKWILSSDPSRDISYSQLLVLNRCEHQLGKA
ncbi:hypothetical protein [Pseudomonas iridis]|uniref:hypothetical protein n=1 Tax=Pseudomonas iridis TaxID=2710587 RepID=UPI001E58E106|nr:hypothetical protein [Pseudomonas iridis]